MSNKLVAAIFDMDGVLIDSYDAHFQSWQIALAAKNIEFTEVQFAETFGKTNKEILPTLLPREATSHDTIAEIEASKEYAFREIVREKFPVMEGAQNLLTSLRDEKFLIAVASSGPPENVSLCMEQIGNHLFDAAVTSADVQHGKPDPEVFLRAALTLQIPAARGVVIEDAPVGITAAHAAGMACVGLMSTGRNAEELAAADLTVQSLHELTPRKLLSLID